MSQYWGAYHGIAMVLDEKEFNAFLKEYESTDPDVRYFVEEEGLRDYTFHAKNNHEVTFDIVDVTEDDCDGMILYPFMNEDGTVNRQIMDENGKIIQTLKYKSFRGTSCYVIFADKDMTCGSVFLGPDYRYNTYEELVNEFREKISGYLPASFDMDNHIGDFSYACYA